MRWIAACAVAPLLAQTGIEISGRVIDSSTGEPLARVRVAVVETNTASVTGSSGEFKIQGGPGGATLRVTAVGYRPYQIRLSQVQGAMEILLAPETLRHSESVQVTAGAFQEETPRAVSLSGNELKNLASVLADDPMRAVQGLPGVASNDDLQSQFSLRGAQFQRIGLYLDGVLLHAPFHTVQGDPGSASLTIFNGDILDTVNLHAGAPPVRYGDRTAGALDVRTRDGDRRRFSVRGTASMSNAGVMAEGPLGRSKRGSWLAAARKSYLQYIIDRTSDDPTIGFAFSDVQGRVQRDFGKRWSGSLGLIHGTSGLDRTGAERNVGLNTLFRTDYDFSVATANLRFAPGKAILANSRISLLREQYLNRNRTDATLGRGFYREWAWNTDVTWQQVSHAALEFGAVVRRMGDNGFANRIQNAPLPPVTIDQHRGTGVRSGGYVQQSLGLAQGRVQLTAGGRVDGHSLAQRHAAMPFASAAVQPTAATRLSLAWGQYVQFPEVSQYMARTGFRFLLPERAVHTEAALDQRIGERTRVRLQVYNRDDRDLLFRPLLEPRALPGGRLYYGNILAPTGNTLRGYSRGWQAFLQRRTANGFTGWIGYSWGKTGVRDDRLGIRFPADFDQRHTVNLFGSYRLRPTVNLSTKWVYGSGFPVRGFYSGTAAEFLLFTERNRLRIPAYQRADFRLNKTFVRDRWQLTLFAEVINLTNHENIRFDELNGIDNRGRVRLGFDKMFPVLPSAGIVMEFY